MGKFLVRFSNLINLSLSIFISGSLVFLRFRRLLTSWRPYSLSDETNIYQQITEVINYLRIAGANNRLPHTYFEFGCHYGRTFSSFGQSFFIKIK